MDTPAPTNRMVLAFFASFTFWACALTSLTARAQDFIQQIPAPPYDILFGRSLATDGTTLVVGDPGFQNVNDDCGLDFGAVNIYKQAGGLWQFNQTIPYTPGFSDNESSFGHWVSLRNNVLVVSAERQDVSQTMLGAGAFFVYRRSSPTALFPTTPLAVESVPNVIGGRFTQFNGVTTNGTYIAATAGPGFMGDSIYVYQIQGNNVVALPPITFPLTTQPVITAVYITTSNALVISTNTDDGGDGTPIAYQLSGLTATLLDTSATSEQFGDLTEYMAGDGNTVVQVKQNTLSVLPTFYYLQVIKFGATGVVSTQKINLPIAYYLDPPLPSGGNPQPIAIGVKENQGFFIGYNGVPGQFGQTYNFLAGYKYLASTGQYYPGGVVRSDQYGFAQSGFGASVAFDGTDLFVGDPSVSFQQGSGCTPPEEVGAVDIFHTVNGTVAGPSGSVKLQPWLDSATLHMGMATATNGTYVLAGSATDGDATVWSGEATLFQNISGAWQQVDRYNDASDNLTSSRAFGTSADIDASFMAIGAPLVANASNVQTGAVFVGGIPFPVGPYLTEVDPPAGAAAGIHFGQSVALTGSTLVVGAPPPNGSGGTGAATRGSVYVYTNTSGTWKETQQLTPTIAGGSDFEGFGTSVDASGNNIIVGIPGRNGRQIAAGAVQIFTLVNGRYVSGGQFSAPTTFPADDELGRTVSIGADYAVAGTKQNGSIVTYHRTGNTWAQDTVITPGTFGFGTAVALEGTRIAVGSPNENRVYRYEHINNVWQRTGTLTNASTATFGTSLDIKNGILAIGDFNASTGTNPITSSGAAYVISITGF